MVSLLPLQFGIPGGPELLVILLIAVLLFGANKIPKLARSTGEAMGEFQKGREEVEKELQEMRDGKQKNQPGTADTESESDTESEPEVETEPDGEVDAEIEDEDEVEIAEAEADEESKS